MDSLKNPVGPEPASVYWRRRALVIGGVLLIIIALVLLWPSGDSTPTGAEASPSPSTSARPSASASASASGSSSASASSSASPSGSESGSASASPSGSGGVCSPSALTLVALPEPTAGSVGGTVKMVMRLTNDSSSACSWDVGAKAVTFTVTSGGQRVWSSDDCNPGGSSDVREIPPGKTFEMTSDWPTVVTQPGCSTQTPARAGSYDVTVTDDSLTSASARFTLA